MLERLLGSKRCKVHDRPLERGSVPVRYGLVRFRDEYRVAAGESFPHARKFVLGECRVGPPREREVLFCSECRDAESQWHVENPDFDDPMNVGVAVNIARRDLADSLAKKMLKQGLLEKPERAGRFLWVVYRLNLRECIAYEAEQKTYAYPFGADECQTYRSVADLADALNDKYGVPN